MWDAIGKWHHLVSVFVAYFFVPEALESVAPCQLLVAAVAAAVVLAFVRHYCQANGLLSAAEPYHNPSGHQIPFDALVASREAVAALHFA